MNRSKPLWKADDQKDRLSELTAQSQDSAKDRALRRDVRSLGALLGRVLVEQVGPELFDTVEELRRLMIRQRERTRKENASDDAWRADGKGAGVNRGDGSDAGLPSDEGFFHLLRIGESGGDQPSQAASAGATVEPGAPAAAGIVSRNVVADEECRISAESAVAALRQITVTPVFTAHPTEVARQTVLLKRRRIAKLLERLDRLPLTVGEAIRCEELMHAEIVSLWQTDEVRQTKPTVDDEIRMGLRYFRLALFETLPRVYAEVVESVRDVYSVILADDELPNLVSFGSWIGGDRDGNPLVKSECTKDASGNCASCDSARVYPAGGIPERLPKFVFAANGSVGRIYAAFGAVQRIDAWGDHALGSGQYRGAIPAISFIRGLPLATKPGRLWTLRVAMKMPANLKPT